MFNIKTALAVGEVVGDAFVSDVVVDDVVVSGCEELVTSWQTGLSQPMQPWGQNNSQGQSKIFIYPSEIITIRMLNNGNSGIFSVTRIKLQLTVNAISFTPKTFSQTSRIVVATRKAFDHFNFTVFNAIIA